MLRSNSKSLGNYVVSHEEEKGRLQCSGKDLQKRKVLSMDDDDDDCSSNGLEAPNSNSLQRSNHG